MFVACTFLLNIVDVSAVVFAVVFQLRFDTQS